MRVSFNLSSGLVVKEKKTRFKIKRREMSLIIGISPLKKYEAKKNKEDSLPIT
jgi:hypothetical protein